MRCNALAETLIIEDIIYAFAADVAHCLKETLSMRRYDSIAILYRRHTSTVGIGCAADRCDYALQQTRTHRKLSIVCGNGKVKSFVSRRAIDVGVLCCPSRRCNSQKLSFQPPARGHLLCVDDYSQWCDNELWCCSPDRQSRRRDVLTNV